MKWDDQTPRRKRPRDYQQLHLRCPRCHRLNSATDIACRHCGANLLQAEVIRGTDYEPFDANEVRKSCLWAIIPGWGLLREGQWGWGILLFGLTVALIAFCWMEPLTPSEGALLLSVLVFGILSAVSVFVTFFAALQRMGVPPPQGREMLLLVARLIGGYSCFLLAIPATYMVSPVGAFVVAWIGWLLVKPFFSKAVED